MFSGFTIQVLNLDLQFFGNRVCYRNEIRWKKQNKTIFVVDMKELLSKTRV